MIIYKCQNKIDGKVYIGKTTQSLNRRKNKQVSTDFLVVHRKGKGKLSLDEMRENNVPFMYRGFEVTPAMWD